MPLDVNIGTIQADAELVDPRALLDPKIIAQITQRVKAEIERDQDVKKQREMDRQGPSRDFRGAR